MQTALSRVMCSAWLDATGALPTEFRIFKAGPNETSKGTTVFDAKAAADVMAQYAKEGVDLMIDLEHHWSDNSAGARADAADARGWFNLELRSGELWAVNVRWTPDGARRLSERTQRYISPLFLERKADSRVARLVNVALVSNPATYGAAPLVAASKFSARNSTVVRSRLTRDQAARFIRLAKAMRTTQGQLLRGLVALATDASEDPMKQIRALAGFLGLPENSTPEDVQDAVRAIAEDAQAMGSAPDESPNAPPGTKKLSAQFQFAPDALESLLKVLNLAPTSTPDEIWNRAMSHNPMSAIAKALGLAGAPTPEDVAGAVEQLLATMPMTAVAFRAELDARGMVVRRDRVVALSKATLDTIKAKGMTLAQYELGVNSVRRAGDKR